MDSSPMLFLFLGICQKYVKKYIIDRKNLIIVHTYNYFILSVNSMLHKNVIERKNISHKMFYRHLNGAIVC